MSEHGSIHELRRNVDYLYCDECHRHVPSIRLERGVWEIQCPRCAGECGLCGCRSVGFCFSKGKTPVQTHMYVVDQNEK